ncbi:MAG: polyisoprenoid-binding protein [Sphingomonadales bacterium]|nr:MAG: polyisoprenoid-binding protein [Sphingomonadales bacterium]
MAFSVKRSLRYAVAAFALAAAPAAHGQALDVPSGVYAVDPTHASVTWKVMHLGLAKYTARFTKVDAELTLDAADPTKSKVFVAIDPRSVRTDYPNPEKEDFDKKLGTGTDWLNGDKFPQIVFHSRALERLTATTGKMTGDMTFLGVTKPVTFDVTLNGNFKEHPFTKKAALGFSAKTTIKRSDWGFKTFVPNIADEVEVLVEAEFQAK